MKYDKIYLKEGRSDVFLETYIADSVLGLTRKAILVIPGGGYGGVCADREGEPIALAFLPYGYSAFVLHYTVARKEAYPAQLREVTMALSTSKTTPKSTALIPTSSSSRAFPRGAT